MRNLLLQLVLAIYSSSFLSAQTLSPEELNRCEAEARDVTIARDTWGIPHIYGKTDANAVFGLLYAECEDDFPRVEKNYLEMLGRQAEAYGESFLTTDIMMRLVYDSSKAMDDYAKSPVWMHKLLDAFADGVNFYLYKHPQVQPLVLKRFQPWYPLMFTDGSVSATSTGGIRQDEIRNFYQRNTGTLGDHPAIQHVPSVSDIEKMVLADRGIGAPDEVKPDDSGAGVGGDADERESGSNGFALAGFRTASGNPELYINPHVPFYFRLEVQITSEEGLDAYGAVTWGQFFVYQGFNAHCGWMHTTSYADVADLYEEKVHQRDSSWQYEYEGQLRHVNSRSLMFYVKKDKGIQVVPLKGYFTHHGPVMASRNGKWLSLKEYNRSLNALEEAWLVTKANTFDEYKKAMELRANTTNNTVYADDQGNIAYWHGNFMPRRDTAYNWALPVDGTIAATEWKGLHELDEIVHVYNPATGWIENCNSTPFSNSGNSSPLRSQYPAYMAPDGENFRALNAARLLSGADNFTLDSLIQKGYDRYLAAFEILLPPLFEAYASAPDSVKRSLYQPILYLQRWDKRCAVHSIATTLAVEWGSRMSQYAPRPRTPEDASNGIINVEAEVTNSTPSQKLTELQAAVRDLEARYGNWKLEWGDICRYQRLTGKIVETYDDRQPSIATGLVSSAFGALPSFQSRLMPGTKKRYGYSGNSFVAAVEFGKKLKAKTVVTGGESGQPGSPHFSDQAGLYVNGVFKDVYFYKEDVMANMENKYHPGEQ
jgi:acyl-homoserine lactone acylase PvdQ